MQGKSRGLSTNRTKLHPPHCPPDLSFHSNINIEKKPRRRQTSSHCRPHLSTSPHSFLFLAIIALTDPSLFPGSITLIRLLPCFLSTSSNPHTPLVSACPVVTTHHQLPEHCSIHFTQFEYPYLTDISSTNSLLRDRDRLWG